jgi:hypothetical protein
MIKTGLAVLWGTSIIPSDQQICAICRKAVLLENAKTDDAGKAVHEECYVQKIGTTTESDSDPKKIGDSSQH